MASLGSFVVAAANTVAPGDKCLIDQATGQVLKATAGTQAGRYVAGVPIVAYAGFGATAGQSVALFEDPLEAMLCSSARRAAGQNP